MKLKFCLSTVLLCCLPLLLFNILIFNHAFHRRDSLFVQLLDLVGVPSTFHMPDLSCSGCNNFDNKYSIDAALSSVCSEVDDVFLLVLTLSHAENVHRRKAVRQTWGSILEHNGRSMVDKTNTGTKNNTVAHS